MSEVCGILSQIMTQKVQHMQLPEKHKNVGRISMTFTNLQVAQITPPRIQIRPSPYTPHQVTASMQVDQLVIYGEVVSSMRLLDDRVFYVTLSNVEINIDVALAKMPSGQMHAEITGCNFYLGDVSVQTKHFNKNRFTYSGIAERKLRSELEDGMCNQITQKGNRVLNTILEKYPTKVRLSDFVPAKHRSKFRVKNYSNGNVAGSSDALEIFGKDLSALRNIMLDTSLVSDPKVVSADSLEFDIRGNVLWMGRSPAPFYPPPIRTTSKPSDSSMLVIYASESVPNALLYQLHQHGIFNMRIDKDSKSELSSLLRKNCRGWFCINSFLPQFRTMYPSEMPVIYLRTRSPPLIHIDPRMVTIEIEAHLSLNAESPRSRSASVEVLSMDIKAIASLVPQIQGNRLKAKVLSATLKTSTERNTLKVDPNKVEVLADIIRKAFEDGVQSIAKNGVQLPQSPLFDIRSGRVYLHDRAIEFDLAPKFNEKFLMDKLKNLFGGLIS
uniref:BPI2 domain-containing protein n=1 Tax=Trichuris muris TaxID=70415 RepID=A0A5S6QQC7_TRIMR